MPINMTVHNPRAGVISAETNGNVVTSSADADDVALDRVDEVVGAAAGATDDVEGMSVQMDRVLE